jgi:putative glutamine amidotransferase
MPRPLIAVSAAMEAMPTAFGEKDCTKLTGAYTNAVYAAGGQPVILPVIANPPADLLGRMDGLLLTGGGDIDPSLYGERPDPSVYGVRRDRDDFEVALYQAAVRLGLPILGICRGMQLINILRGGNLLQQVDDHWQTVPGDQPSHAITVAAGSRLAEAVGGQAAEVNSYHHQGIGRLGDDLTVVATCGDVIEAVEAVDADLVAVQWHPEHMTVTDQRQRNLFDTFIGRAASRNQINDHQEKTLCPTT